MKRIIFFDGYCNLCSGMVDFVIQRDPTHKFRFSSLQSNFAKAQLPDRHKSLDSVILLEDERISTESTAALRILFQLGGFWSIFSMLASIFPLFIRDRIYRFIARNRYKLFGKKDTCRLPMDAEKKLFLD
jgi:predicted DCC family thiol-disulfide oxidoreductase YuxK